MRTTLRKLSSSTVSSKGRSHKETIVSKFLLKRTHHDFGREEEDPESQPQSVSKRASARRS